MVFTSSKKMIRHNIRRLRCTQRRPLEKTSRIELEKLVFRRGHDSDGGQGKEHVNMLSMLAIKAGKSLTNYGSTQILYSHALRSHDRIKHMGLNMRIKREENTYRFTYREKISNKCRCQYCFFLLF